MDEDALQVRDTTAGAFRVIVHLGPEVEILETGPGFILTNFFTLRFDPGREYEVDAYDYAGRYQSIKRSRRLSIRAESEASMNFDLTHGK